MPTNNAAESIDSQETAAPAGAPEGTTTPASPAAPVPPAGGESDEAPEGDGIDWGELVSGFSGTPEAAEGESDEASAEDEGASPAPSEGQPPKEGVEKPKDEEGEPPTPEEPPAEAPHEEEPPTPETPPEPETPEQPSPEDIAARQAADRAAAREKLAQAYKLSDEDVENWETNSAEMLPGIAADLHLNVFESVLNSLRQELPQMVRQINQMETNQAAFSTAFFDKWPKLKEHGELVNKYLKAYASVNPNATREQMINDVGLQAMVQLKIPIEGLPTGGNDEPPPKTTTVTPAPEARREVPFTPGQPGGGTPPAAQPETNEWEDLINDE